MSDKFGTFMERMTNLNWFRLTVCLLPGLFLTKLGTKIESVPFLQLAGTICLILGVAVYAFWGRISQQYFGINDEDFTEENESSAPNTLNMSDLVKLCDGDYEEATNLVSIENQMNADISFSAAITAAYKRKSLALKTH